MATLNCAYTDTHNSNYVFTAHQELNNNQFNYIILYFIFKEVAMYPILFWYCVWVRINTTMFTLLSPLIISQIVASFSCDDRMLLQCYYRRRCNAAALMLPLLLLQCRHGRCFNATTTSVVMLPRTLL